MISLFRGNGGISLSKTVMGIVLSSCLRILVPSNMPINIIGKLIYPYSIYLFYTNRYNRVFVLDCTYKTNKFKMPLLHVVGMSPSNSSFSVAFCFMKHEQEGGYVWALRTLFSWLDPISDPPVLCTDRELALIGK